MLPGTYLNPRHVCDGGDVGCSSRRRIRSNRSILQGFPTPKCAPEQALAPALPSSSPWAVSNGDQPLLIAPSLRVAARAARGGRSSACARGRRCDPAAGQARRIESTCLCTPTRSHPRKRGPCSTLRRAVCVVARLDPIDIGPAAVRLASIPSWPQRITRLLLR